MTRSFALGFMTSIKIDSSFLQILITSDSIESFHQKDFQQKISIKFSNKFPNKFSMERTARPVCFSWNMSNHKAIEIYIYFCEIFFQSSLMFILAITQSIKGYQAPHFKIIPPLLGSPHPPPPTLPANWSFKFSLLTEKQL